MSPYVYTFFVIISVILIALIIYFQIGREGEWRYNQGAGYCPKGCKNGKCLKPDSCLECYPNDLKCCCYDQQCQRCKYLENIGEETPFECVRMPNYHERVLKQNRYIRNLNKEIKQLNSEL